jgi:hypothetical protein
MYRFHNLALISIIIFIFINFISCKEGEIVTTSDENSQVFHLRFNAVEVFQSNKVVGNVIRVNFEAFNTKEIPTIITNGDTIFNTHYNSFIGTVTGSGDIRDTSIIDFQVINKGKITKGIFVIPDPVSNLICNGFIFKPLIELKDINVFHHITTDTVYSINWNGNSNYYIMSINYGELHYDGSETNFTFPHGSGYWTYKPSSIELTSYSRYLLKSGDLPNYVGTYGSGYVSGSRRFTYRYEP